MNLEPRTLLNSADVAAFCERLAHEPFVAVDTEFHGEGLYFPALLLIQLATSREIVFLDPVGTDTSAADLAAILRTVRENDGLLVGHALSNDLTLLFRAADEPPGRVFDTQVAASFLGHGPQVGLKTLLATTLGVEIAKGQSMADWERRPLSPEQLEYAAEDVRYLLRLTAVLRDELEQAGRLAWADEECARLREPSALAAPDVTDAVTRVRRRPKDGTPEAHRLTFLAAERERIAQEANRPRRWILPDERLVDIAQRDPETMTTLLDDNNRRPANGLERHAERWLAALEHARETAPPPAPATTAPRRTPGQRALLDLLRLAITAKAEEEELAPALLLSPIKTRLGAALRAPTATGPAGRAELLKRLRLSGWRADLLGDTLWGLVSGEVVARSSRRGDRLELRWEDAGSESAPAPIDPLAQLSQLARGLHGRRLPHLRKLFRTGANHAFQRLAAGLRALPGKKKD